MDHPHNLVNFAFLHAHPIGDSQALVRNIIRALQHKNHLKIAPFGSASPDKVLPIFNMPREWRRCISNDLLRLFNGDAVLRDVAAIYFIPGEDHNRSITRTWFGESNSSFSTADSGELPGGKHTAYTCGMNDILESILELLERQVESELSTIKNEVEDMIAIHVGLFAALESRKAKKGWTEASASLFRRWLKAAHRMEALAVRFRANGQLVRNFEDLVSMIERSKPLAQALDDTVE